MDDYNVVTVRIETWEFECCAPLPVVGENLRGLCTRFRSRCGSTGRFMEESIPTRWNLRPGSFVRSGSSAVNFSNKGPGAGCWCLGASILFESRRSHGFFAACHRWLPVVVAGWRRPLSSSLLFLRGDEGAQLH